MGLLDCRVMEIRECEACPLMVQCVDNWVWQCGNAIFYSHLPEPNVLLKVWGFFGIFMNRTEDLASLWIIVSKSQSLKHTLWEASKAQPEMPHTFPFSLLENLWFYPSATALLPLQSPPESPTKQRRAQPCPAARDPSGEPCPADQHAWAWEREAACPLEIKLAAANSLPGVRVQQIPELGCPARKQRLAI